MAARQFMTFVNIKKILPKSVKSAGISVKLDEAKILAHFEEVAVKIYGDQVLKKMKALHIKDGTIYLACLSDLLAQQIKNQERRFLFELNKPLGKSVIEKIRFL